MLCYTLYVVGNEGSGSLEAEILLTSIAQSGDGLVQPEPHGRTVRNARLLLRVVLSTCPGVPSMFFICVPFSESPWGVRATSSSGEKVGSQLWRYKKVLFVKTLHGFRALYDLFHRRQGRIDVKCLTKS